MADGGVPTAVKGNKYQYDEFYDVHEVWRVAVAQFTDSVAMAPIDEERLRTAAIILTRMVTMCRAADAAQLHTDFQDLGADVRLRMRVKGGDSRLFRVTGIADAIPRYRAAVADAEAPYLFRHLRAHSQVMGAERIAKTSMAFLRRCGVDVAVFKSHSLRGATATHFIACGLQPLVVQARSGWKSEATFREHYFRGHQLIDWCGLFGPREPLAGGKSDDGPQPGRCPVGPLVAAGDGRRRCVVG